MSVIRRQHVQVDPVGVARRYPPTPFRRIRPTADELATPDKVARVLDQMQEAFDESTRAARSNPSNQSTIYMGQQLTSGRSLTLQPRLGRAAFWRVVRWRNAAAGPSIVETTNDGTTLTLSAFVTGVADLEVW